MAPVGDCLRPYQISGWRSPRPGANTAAGPPCRTMTPDSRLPGVSRQARHTDRASAGRQCGPACPGRAASHAVPAVCRCGAQRAEHSDRQNDDERMPRPTVRSPPFCLSSAGPLHTACTGFRGPSAQARGGRRKTSKRRRSVTAAPLADVDRAGHHVVLVAARGQAVTRSSSDNACRRQPAARSSTTAASGRPATATRRHVSDDRRLPLVARAALQDDAAPSPADLGRSRLLQAPLEQV
jgi:hypothetical protein